MGLGLNILALLFMVPVWNAAMMLRDPIFQYFLGDQIPARILSMCVAIAVAYVITIPLFFHRSHQETHTETTMLNVGTMFITLVGGIALLIAYPLRGTATTIGTELIQQSRYGPRTYEIFRTSLELQYLRNQTGCRNLTSIELCAGYVETPTTELMREMEFSLRCSGWGVRASGTTSGGTQAPIDAPLEPRAIRAHGRLPAVRSLASADRADATEPLTPSTPRTLFSLQQHPASCDGMAGRKMKYFLEDVSDELFYEGVYLLCISIVVGFLKLLGFCAADPYYAAIERKMGVEYGSLEDERPYSSNPAQVSRVFQGILRR
jgi:hypothetical protein